MNRKAQVIALTMVAGLAAPALAQDSISKNQTGLPGDALNWVDPTAQRTRYVVDSQQITSSWGVPFGVAPIIKTDRSVNPALSQGTIFFNNLFSGFGMSRTVRTAPFRGSSYLFWNQAGGGLNAEQNDTALNTTETPSGSSFQFTAFMNQFGSASTPASQSTVNSGIGAVVNVSNDLPRRFFVERSLLNATSATGGATSANGAQAVGASDSNGQFVFRADANAANSPSGRILNQNLGQVNLLNRSSSLNVLSSTGTTTTATDTAATRFVGGLNNFGTTLTVPSALPASLSSDGDTRYLGPTFGRSYVYENAAGNAVFGAAGGDYLTAVPSAGANFPDHRGAIAVLPRSLFAGTVATGAVLARSGTIGSNNDYVAVFGIDNNGAVPAGARFALPVPLTVPLDRAPASDNPPGGVGPDLFGSPAPIPATMTGAWAYHQGGTAFNGPNAAVAIGRDLAGRGLVAGLMYENITAPTWNADVTPTPNVAIVVGRFDPANPAGTVEWRVVAWTYAAGFDPADHDGTPIRGDAGTAGHFSTSVPSSGRRDGILDLNPASATYDRPIGRLQPTLSFPGPTAGAAPSITPPAIDSVGNIWFVARGAFNTYSSTTLSGFARFNSTLIRAVYNPDTFTYDLEEVLEFGDRVYGKNSLTTYSIGGFVLSNALTSLTNPGAPNPAAFGSSSVTAGADRNIDPATLPTFGTAGAVADPRSLGGLVIGANILYDVNNDDEFEDPSGTAPANPASIDEGYSALLYVSFRSCNADLNGDSVVDNSDFVLFANAYNNFLDTLGDFNNDGFTDNSDFVVFANAYNDFLCFLQPGTPE